MKNMIFLILNNFSLLLLYLFGGSLLVVIAISLENIYSANDSYIWTTSEYNPTYALFSSGIFLLLLSLILSVRKISSGLEFSIGSFIFGLILPAILGSVIPNYFFQAPRKFDNFEVINNKNEVLWDFVVRRECYALNEIKEEILTNILEIEKPHPKNLKFEMVDQYYSFRAAQLFDSRPYYSKCDKSNQLEYFSTDRIFYAIRYASERTFNYLLVVFLFMVIPYSIWEYFKKRSGQKDLDYRWLYRISIAVLSIVIVLNVLYFLELK